MKSHFETEINVPQARLAEFYSNPENNVKWMDDIERCEFIQGVPGTIGSKYRLIPKKGNMIFTATVISRDLPDRVQLILDAYNVNVLVTGKFIALSPTRTKFISEETLKFKGFINKLFGVFATGAIKKAHKKHMNDFVKVVMG